MQILFESNIGTWRPLVEDAQRTALAQALEDGKIIYLPRLRFEMTPDEKRFLSEQWLDGTRKNISLENGSVHGARGSADDLKQLAALIERFSTQANQLVRNVFLLYAKHLQLARTSYRPAMVDNRAVSWRKDDSRLHVDAFPSRPNYGERILRVFTNINPYNEPRVWRAGEPFENAARHFLPKIRRPLPGSAQLLAALGITKSKRSEYDHIMLHLHDAMKADELYQKNAEQQKIPFAAGSTWICFTDQVLHAAMEGQFLLEQTLHLPVQAQYHPELSPLKTLERLRRRALV